MKVLITYLHLFCDMILFRTNVSLGCISHVTSSTGAKHLCSLWSVSIHFMLSFWTNNQTSVERPTDQSVEQPTDQLSDQLFYKVAMMAPLFNLQIFSVFLHSFIIFTLIKHPHYNRKFANIERLVIVLKCDIFFILSSARQCPAKSSITQFQLRTLKISY